MKRIMVTSTLAMMAGGGVLFGAGAFQPMLNPLPVEVGWAIVILAAIPGVAAQFALMYRGEYGD